MGCRRTAAALAVVAAIGSRADAVGQSGISVGVKGGLNIADVSSRQFGFGGVGTRNAWLGGAFITFMGDANVGVQPELLYTRKGFAALVPDGTAAVELDYVEIPVLVRFRVGPEGRRVRPAVFGGLFLALEAGCSLSGQLAGLEGSSDCEALVAGRGEMDGGFVVGAGVDIGLRDRLFLLLDARYSHGILNIDWQEESDKVSSRVWSFMVGAGLLLGF
jgi:hypothetical protein